MNDLIVVLPGIMGSALEKHGRVVWDTTFSASMTAMFSRGVSITDLALDGDDEGEYPRDGVVATHLVDNLTVVPGYWKVAGYTALREALVKELGLTRVGIDDQQTGNYLEFPYDWRRDLRVTAQRLRRIALEKLAAWKRDGGDGDSRLIVIAHSMGGLIARYALECLDLWRSTRALITLATPHRGAPQALDYLVNGRKVSRFGRVWLDLGGVLRSLPASYQLLPRYPVVQTVDGPKRVTEVGPASLGLEPAMLARMTEFHAELDRAIERNASDADYRDKDKGYRLIPVVGVGQQTVLGSRWADGVLTSSKVRFDWLPEDVPDGDGTVPMLAAIPIDQNDLKDFRGFSVAQAHESLQNDQAVIDALIVRLRFFQAPDLTRFRTAKPRDLSVAIDDATLSDQPVIIRARINQLEGLPQTGLEAVVRAAHEGQAPPLVVPLQPGEDDWAVGTATGLPPGLYWAKVMALGPDDNGFATVDTGFAVIQADQASTPR